MQITRSSIDTQKGPADWFTGDVYIDAVAAPAGTSTFAAANVHFTPGARTAWHTHPHGQTIFVTEGVGLCQREGGPVEVIRPGDRVFFEPGENHWHGAASNRFMVHIAMRRWPGRPVADARAAVQEDAASMFLVTTSIVRPSSSVGLNSTTSVPAYRTGVCPGPT
jgi:quercetin dioxygenase-like cupin family protein